MSNKKNHRRAHGDIRRRRPHRVGRAVCGMCGPKSMLQKRAIVERIEQSELPLPRIIPTPRDPRAGQQQKETNP